MTLIIHEYIEYFSYKENLWWTLPCPTISILEVKNARGFTVRLGSGRYILLFAWNRISAGAQVKTFGITTFSSPHAILQRERGIISCIDPSAR